MNFYRYFLFLGCILTSFILSIPVLGDDGPVMVVTVSGNESIISEPEPGVYQAEIQKINTNATVTLEGKTIEIPISFTLISNSSAGAIELVNNEGDALIFMIQTTDLEYVDKNQTMRLEMVPQEYSDGTRLTPDNQTISDILPGSYTQTTVTLEFQSPVVSNDPDRFCCSFDQINRKACQPARPLCGY